MAITKSGMMDAVTWWNTLRRRYDCWRKYTRHGRPCPHTARYHRKGGPPSEQRG